MYLSKLEILGFKSFANKTTLALNDGITAIVGPNGCGKTNIVDALRWALGEQRYSTLRSDKMEDVIFNGTKNRKPIGLAEVSLTIHNNRGILPVEFNEVTITRRVFRSGESDYLLNRASCRLKDIVSLFMDTGMGSNAYSVIELKMVETILSDRMEERRRLFEEAAGVTRYKARRKEAFRRLDEVEADLLRVNDIISEVEKAVNSLNRQAKKAERYNDYLERLRALEVEVLQRDYTGLLLRLAPLEQRLGAAIAERDSMNTKVEQEEVLLHTIRAEERDIEEQLEMARREHGSILARGNEYEQNLLVTKERQRGLAQSIDRYELTREAASVRGEESRGLLEQHGSTLESLELGLQQLEEDVTRRRETHKAIEEDLSRRKLEANLRQQRRMQFVQEIARLENDVEKCDARISTIDNMLEHFTKEDEEAAVQMEELRRRLADEDQGKTAHIELLLEAEREFHAKEGRKNELREEIDQLQNHAFELQSQIGEKMTKIDFISGLVDRLEGYSESVQHLLRNREWSAARPGTVADAINTRDDLRVAIESVLGDAAHYLIVSDVNEAISGLQNLKHSRKGKATFVCLSRVPQIKAIPFPIAGEGVVGWADELVTYAPQHYSLFQFLLQNVLIVRDAGVAHASVREYPHIRCVTTEGDIFDSNGLVRGGSHGQDEGGLIGKKDQIAQLQKEVQELKRQLEDNQEVIGDRNLDYTGIDLKMYAEKMKQAQQELSAHERHIAGLLFEVEKLERVLQKNATERERLVAERSDLLAQKDQTAPLIEEQRGLQASMEQETESESARLAELEAGYNHSNEQLNASNIALATRRGELQNLRNDMERLQRDIADAEKTRLHAEEDIERARKETESLAAEIMRITQAAELMTEEKMKAAERVREVEGELAAKRNDADRVEQLLHDERLQHNQSVSLVHETELKVAEIKQRMEQLSQHAREDFEFELQPMQIDDDDVFDLGQAREEIRDLRVKVKALGLVNPLAFEEWKKEKERLDLLTTQRADLVESQQTLNETINEINRTAKEKFIETFRLIRENFILIFKSLFDEGDEADLILQEHEDPLEARIDIVAKPRGKRPHSIEMLSGGEKTLTAIALLFAIYLVKPSPFCILDEVDAPLDDANIDRFIRILRRFSNNTQFIVVTHNKRTMAAADSLYGVTMEEEGVSRIVAVDFHRDNLVRFSNN